MADTAGGCPMGVRYNYFHTTDRDTATDWAVGPDRREHPWSRLEEVGADRVELKGLDPDVVLGQLVAYARGVGFQVGDDGPDVVWPDVDWPDAAEWHEESGLLIEEIPVSWRDTLAAVDDEELPGIAACWEGIEEVRFKDRREAQECARVFVGLARRARAAGTTLYCVGCL
ncbi:hypothetical protein ACFW3D_08655 [Streptomyces sp. NPDC058864]